MDNKIPPPVTFNCWKHHLGFLREQVPLLSLEKLAVKIKKMGGSQADMYAGELDPAEIAREIIAPLEAQGLLEPSSFRTRVLSGGGEFKISEIKDGSTWMVRAIPDKINYIHIFPARNSEHCFRVKGITLKSAVLYYSARPEEENEINLELLNSLREKYLGEPPLKSLEDSAGLAKIIAILKKEN